MSRGYVPSKEQQAYDNARDEYLKKVRVRATKLIEAGFSPERAEQRARDALERLALRELSDDGD